MRLEIILANEEETKEYEKSNVYSGLPNELSELKNHQLPQMIYENVFKNNTKGASCDARHLSMASRSRKKLIRWAARSESGYYYNFGPVMRIIKI